MKHCILIIIILLLFPQGQYASTGAEEDIFNPVTNPTLSVIKTSESIKIDGYLNDPGWKKAARAENFSEVNPGNSIKPPVKTKAFITYDNEKLYAAFVCYDNPATVRASFTERDNSNLSADDLICLLIDTYGDASWAYELYVNPHGIQMDWLWLAGGVEDPGHDLIWESAGQITDSGYQVEMAIPFSSMRFPHSHEQTWKVNFWRNHPRESFRQYSWAAIDWNNSCWTCQWGTLTGISDIKESMGIEVIPSLLGYQSGELNGNGRTESPFNFTNNDPDGEASLLVRYTPSSNITIEATTNPDFSQIEADVAQIDVNTSLALFYPEKRPFFQEGYDIFQTWLNTFYSRIINNPQFATKVTARFPRASLAFISAFDENSPFIIPFVESSAYLQGGKSFSNVLRFRQSFGSNSHAGLLVTDRRLDGGGSGTLVSADGRIYLHQKIRLNWQVIGTHTQEPEDKELKDQIDYLIDIDRIPRAIGGNGYTSTFDGESFTGHALQFDLEHRSRYLGLDLTYDELSPTYRADNGFETVNDRRKLDLYTSYTFYLDRSIIQQINPYFLLGSVWDFQGLQKDKYIWMNLVTQLRFAQTYLQTVHMRSVEQYHNFLYEDLWTFQQIIQIIPSKLLFIRANFMWAKNIARLLYVPSRERLYYFTVRLQPTDRIFIEARYNPQWSWHRLSKELLFEGYIARLKLSYQCTKELALRLVAQYNDFYSTWDIDPLLTYRLNPYSVLYLGSTYDYSRFEGLGEDETDHTTRMSSRQFFLKLQYLFQI